MPFTFSHPAAVLIFRFLPKKWYSLTGLVVGSIVPDFEKFIKMQPGNSLSHTWEGLLFFNLPVGLLLSLLFHIVVRNPIIGNLPTFFQRRLIHLRTFDWIKHIKAHLLLVSASILIGAFIHIGWDSITHKQGLIVRLIPLLEQKVFIYGDAYSIYGLLDILSTVVGGLLLITSFALLPVNTSKVDIPRNKLNYWLITGLVAFCVISLRIVLGLGKNWHWELIISSISAVLIGILLASLLMKLMPKKEVKFLVKN